MDVEENYEVVPWFSRDEWKEVYESIFSNSAERWEFAFYKLLVWKARKHDLHVGIESTIPILLAQMAFSDPTLCFPFKSVIIDWAISRFVTITMKGHHAPGMTMRNIAPRINMPIYLIDLRNETSHDDSKLASTLLLQTALSDSLSFIKSSYWDDENAACSYELKGVKSPSHDVTKVLDSNNISDNDSEKENNDLSHLFKNIIKLNKLIFKTAKLTTFQVKSSMVDKNELMACKHQIRIVRESLENYIIINLSKSMQTLVKMLFYSNYMKKCIKNTYSQKNKKCKKCIILIPPQLLALLSPIIGFILKAGAIECLFETLLNSFEDLGCPNLCSQWIRILLNTFFPLKKFGCGLHIFKKGITVSHLSNVNWKRVLFQLFSIDQSWSLAIALHLAKNLGIEEEKIFTLIELHSVYALSKNSTCDEIELQVDDDKIDSYLNSDNIRNLDELLTEAHKVSTDVHGYVEELGKCLPLRSSKSSGKEKIKSSEFIPLGLLPDQKLDSSFFQKLKLTSNLAKSSLWSHCK